MRNSNTDLNFFISTLRKLADELEKDPSILDTILNIKNHKENIVSSSNNLPKDSLNKEDTLNIFSLYSSMDIEDFTNHLNSLKISEIRNLVKSNGLGIKSSKKETLVLKITEFLKKKTTDVFINL